MKSILKGIVVIVSIVIVALGLKLWLWTDIEFNSIDLDPDYPPTLSTERLSELAEMAMAGDTNASIGLVMYYGMNKKYKEEMRWMQVSADLGSEYMQECLDDWRRHKKEGGTAPRYDFDFDAIIEKARSNLCIQQAKNENESE